MDILHSMRTLGVVARQGSFTAAGRELGLSTTSISRIVADLEAELGVLLLNRTTRQVALTEPGLEFVQASAGVLEEVELLCRRTKETRAQPSGTLRIASLVGFGNDCLAPAISVFRERYPEIKIYLEVGTDVVDLIDQPFDIAIRTSELKDSSMVARTITNQKAIIVAAPALVNKLGMPRSLEDLKHFPSVTLIGGKWGRTHQFHFENEVISFETSRDYVVNSLPALRNTIVSGYGFGIALDFSVARDLDEGRLVQLLPDYKSTEQSIYAVFPNRRYLPAKVRLFIDFLSEMFSQRKQNGNNRGQTTFK